MYVLFETSFCFKRLHKKRARWQKKTRPLVAKRRSWWQPPRPLFGRLLAVCWRGHEGRVLWRAQAIALAPLSLLVSEGATALGRPRGARGRRSPPRRTVDFTPSVP